MAKPITMILKTEYTEHQLKEQKLENLKSLLTENEEALNQVFAIIAELNDMGALEAASKLMEAKEEAAQIALGQLTRKPVTNIINHIMGVAGALAEMDPNTTSKLLAGVNEGMTQGNAAIATDEKMSALKLAKMMNDPDVNRALKFGVHFLKGFGQNLKE